MVTLNESYFGYTQGELTGRVNYYRYEIRLASGKCIWLYEDEFKMNK